VSDEQNRRCEWRRRFCSITLLAIGALLGQANAWAGGEATLAVVGGREITGADLEARLASLPFPAREQYLSPAGRRNLLEQMIEEELYYREALLQGLELDPAFISRFRTMEKSLLSSALIRQLSPRNKATNEEEVAADCLTKCRRRFPVTIDRAALTGSLSEDPQRVLAAVGVERITAAELNEVVQKIPPARRSDYETAAGREALLEKLVNQQLLCLEARRRGLDREPELAGRLGQIKRAMLVEQYRRDMESREATVVTEEEMRAFYEANRELFVMPEKVRVRLILVRIDRESSASETAAAREKIGQAAAELRRGVDFAQVAQRYSEDVESRGNGGLLPPCPRGVRGEAFDRTAFSLSAPGQISDMYLDKHGYQLLQLVQRSEPRQESFREVRASLERRVVAEKRQTIRRATLTRLRQKYSVTVFEDRLQGLRWSAE